MNNNKNSSNKRVRNPFSKHEDILLEELVKIYGISNWNKIAQLMKNRTVRQCRERWQNSLSPSIIKKNWSSEEDQLLLQKHELLGPKWKEIESYFIGRTLYSLGNRYKSIIKQRIPNNYKNFKNEKKKENDIKSDDNSNKNSTIISDKYQNHELNDNFNDDWFDRIFSFE